MGSAMLKYFFRNWHPYIFLLALIIAATPTAQNHADKLVENYAFTTNHKLQIKEGVLEFSSLGVASYVVAQQTKSLSLLASLIRL